MGTAGTRDAVGSQGAGLVRRVRDCTGLPVAVGLGVRDRAQAAEVAGLANGVIVGSAFGSRLLGAEDASTGIAAVRDLASDLATAARERMAAPSPGPTKELLSHAPFSCHSDRRPVTIPLR